MLTVTDQASEKIRHLCEEEVASSSTHAFFRVAVLSGGCSGFQYQFSLDHQKNETDIVVESTNSLVVVDDVSITFLGTSQLDYVQDLSGASFVIKNPEAQSSCGCGQSFAV